MTAEKEVALGFISMKWMNEDSAAERITCFCVRKFHTRYFCILNTNSLEKKKKKEKKKILVLSADIFLKDTSSCSTYRCKERSQMSAAWFLTRLGGTQPGTVGP